MTIRLNLACLAVGSTKEATVKRNGQPYPPQSSLFGCRFDRFISSPDSSYSVRLNLACLAVGSTNTTSRRLRDEMSASI